MKNNLCNFASFASIMHFVVQRTDFKCFLNLCHPGYSHQFSWNKTIFLIIVHILTLSIICLLIFCLLDLSVTTKEVLESSTIIVYLSISTFMVYHLLPWVTWCFVVRCIDIYTYRGLFFCKIDFFHYYYLLLFFNC